VVVDDQEVWLAEGHFTHFFQIASAIHLETNGMFHIESLYGSENNPPQKVNRLRDKLKGCIDCDSKKFIRLPGDGNAILTVPPDNVSYNFDNLMEHSNETVRHTAEKLYEAIGE